MFRIAGSGGGGGKSGGGAQHTPVEDPDSLNVKSRARVLEVISEGPIQGLVDGLKSVYLDDTVLQNGDGSFNFKDVTLLSTTGTPTQGYITGFPSAEAEVGVDQEVRLDTPVIRSFADSTVDAIRVTLNFPQMEKVNSSNGDIHGTTVQMAIDVQANGGGYQNKVLDTITGKATSAYERSYRIELPKPGPWDIKVRRVTADNHSATLMNQSRWKSYTKITDKKLSFPNSAIIALQMNAEVFSSIPTRGYEACGLICRVPTSYTAPVYNPTTKLWSDPVNTGTWDGSFKLSWTNNPAYLLMELLTNPRWGMGEYVKDTDLDKWAIEAIGRYCDGMVPDGKGGTEPRFRLALYLQTQEDAYKVVQNICSTFRAMSFWGGDRMFLAQDSPATSIAALYTNANVLDGVFTYSSAPLSSKHSVATVSWNNPANNYKTEREYVERKASVDRYGIRQTDIAAMGCIWQGQAHRQGDWALYSEWAEGETATWRTDLEGLCAGPFEVINLCDTNRTGLRIGGRIVAATATQVTIDSAVAIDSTENPLLSVMLSDGTIATKGITNATGSYTVLNLASALTSVPVSDSPWALSTDSLVPLTMRILSIVEIDPNTYEHIAVIHDPNKYSAVELGIELESKPTSLNDSNLTPTAPTALLVTENLYNSGFDLKTNIHVEWTGSLIDKTYSVEYRKDSGNWTVLPEVSAHRADIADVIPGSLYEIRVAALNLLKRSPYSAVSSYIVLGKTMPPADVTGFTIDYNTFGVTLKWNPNPDLDLDGYEIRNGSVWDSATFLNYGSSTSFTIPLTASGSSQFLIKAKDTSGNYSITAASANVTITPTTPATLTMTVSAIKP
jgi:predicted phage tail protein